MRAAIANPHPTTPVIPAKAGTPLFLSGLAMMRGGWLYMMSDRYRGGIYTGVTAYLAERITQHKQGKGSKFVAKYGFTRFVYAEHYDRIDDPMAREKAVKKWRRAWKIELIEKMNPDWDDLYDRIHI